MRLERIKKNKRTKVFQRFQDGNYLVCFGKLMILAQYCKELNTFVTDEGEDIEINQLGITDVYYIDDDRICK